MRRIEGRVAVVTGAASGIGRATSEHLARRGCDVAIVDVAGAAETAKRVEAEGRKASVHVVDVANRPAMESLSDAVRAAHGGAHILVNNAGVSVGAPLENHSIEDFEWIVGINFWGVVYGCRFFLPLLREADEAHIVNVSSVFGLVGVPTQSSYCATKFAVRGFSEALHAELADTRVGVTSVHPGGIRTNIIRSARMADEADRDETQSLFDRFAHSPDAVARKIVRAIERNRLRVLVGAEAYATDWLKRMFPTGFHRVMARLAARRDERRRGAA